MDIERFWIKKIQRLTGALIVSGGLNLALLVAYFYPTNSKKAPIAAAVETATISKGTLKTLNEFFPLGRDELIGELSNCESVEDGYKVRDLALSALVTWHHFNIEKALPAHPFQRRQLALIDREGEHFEISLFPGIGDAQFGAICDFARLEAWPLTTKGLFFELAHREERPESLKQTFYLTREFHTVEVLFHHILNPIAKESLLELIIEGGYERLAAFSARHPLLDEITASDRREMLLDYVGGGSSRAADLLLTLEPEWALHGLDDEHLISLLAPLKGGHEPFLKELISGLRSDRVRTLAGVKLYEILGESPPEPYDHEVTLMRFLPETIQNIVTKEVKPVKTYRIQEGDTLWHISRRFDTSVDEIIEANDLKSSYLLPIGKELIIP